MSVKLKKPLRKVAKAKLDPARPFDPELWRKAERIANRYSIVIREEPDVDGYLGRGVEFFYVMGDGRTPEACIAQTREALTLVVATMLEDGQTPPPPATEEVRTEQVNVRMSGIEKLLIEEASRSRGYRGISDFMRAAALASIR